MANNIPCYFCDNTTSDIAFCTGCHYHLCHECWSNHPPHKRGHLGPAGVPHEKVDPKIVEELTQCMAEPEDESQQDKLHQEDEDTTWFGLERDAGGEPILAEYRRYAAIMAQSSEDYDGLRYPALVSFIGQTGAGKSSLIKLLIDLKNRVKASPDDFISTPIIGRSNATLPTSADVHLYMDPESKASERPILYADCEGLEGGERNPVAANAILGSSVPKDSASLAPRGSNLVKSLARGIKRSIKWATRDSESYEQTSKRGFAVSEMYPRIFYAFSDVIVFVLKNAMTVEVVVEKLLEWADANYSSTNNQPSKPHAIIALNMSNNQTPEDQWNSINATANLLASTSAKITENSTFVKYARKWKNSHFHISNMQDLLKCYYSTVHVVRIPDKSRYQLLDKQRRQLHDKIVECCNVSYETNLERQMLSDVDEFGLYLSLAFDHFSETLEKPFDFIEASLKHRPLSDTLSDNVLSFARHFGSIQGRHGDIDWVFKQLVQFISSCILLESARKQHIGSPQDWFPQRTSEKKGHDVKNKIENTSSAPDVETYRSMCRQAISNYYDLDTPCQHEFHSTLMRGRETCSIYRRTHGENHRAKVTLGTRESWGRFENSFRLNHFAWEDQILEDLIDRQEKCKPSSFAGFRQAVVKGHAECLTAFHKGAGSRFFIKSVCVCCLVNPPNYHLGCGHIICLECALDFGHPDGSTRIIMEQCPLHKDERLEPDKSKQTVISLQPPFSGLRVLVLDGGGIRGIVELSVMKALEDRLGMRLQQFFDLVIGTSTGGIIALAFAHQMWPVHQCIQSFKVMSEHAFTLRKGQNMHFVRRIQLFVKHSRYETKPLEAVLKTIFGHDRPLFGEREVDAEQPLNTGVMATTSAGSQARLLANYNTRASPGQNYKRLRSYHPKEEIATWEAARATSAAPGFFKPFTIGSNSQFPDLIDGGVLYNNPIEIALEEARRLSESNRLLKTPDIVLSLGTGLPARYRQRPEAPSDYEFAGPQFRGPWWRDLFTVISYQVKLNLDTESRWKREFDKSPFKDRMVRFNPDLKKDPPRMDAKSEVPSLELIVAGLFKESAELQLAVTTVACILVASTFYFEKEGKPMSTSGSSAEVYGYIKCRMSNESEDMMKLGSFLEQCQEKPASFLIHNNPQQNTKDREIRIPVNEMIQKRSFTPPRIEIDIVGDEVETVISLKLPRLCRERSHFPISGFPRALMKHDFGPK